MSEPNAHYEGMMTRVTSVQRQMYLQQHIAQCVANGGHVETVLGPYDVVIVWGKPPNHILHALLSIFTVGLWLPFWLLIGLTQKETRKTRHVTEWGQVVDL
jgi:hypothetical protein